MVLEQFDVASGSIVGRDHLGSNALLLGRNNQDAYAISSSPNLLVGIICDGCGSAPHSEVGAKIIAAKLSQMIPLALTRLNGNLDYIEALLERVRLDLLAEIRMLARDLNTSLSRAINDYFLCTTLGFVMRSDQTIVFALGDGYIMLNEQIIPLPQYPNNAPPYLAYGTTGSDTATDPSQFKFQIIAQRSTDDVSSLLIGSDGLDHLASAVGKPIPGKPTLVSPITSLVQEDKYYTNSDALRRYLVLLNSEPCSWDKEAGRLVRHVGHLKDDTTLIAVRRKKQEEPDGILP